MPDPRDMEAALRREARRLEADAWQKYIVSEAAQAMGKWLEKRGSLNRPIGALTMADLEGMTAAAMARWIVVASYRVTERPAESIELIQALTG